PGDVSERPKEHAWKACVVQATEGSNPSVTAKVQGLRIAGPLNFSWMPRDSNQRGAASRQVPVPRGQRLRAARSDVRRGRVAPPSPPAEGPAPRGLHLSPSLPSPSLPPVPSRETSVVSWFSPIFVTRVKFRGRRWGA